jgi:hypothetical protein
MQFISPAHQLLGAEGEHCAVNLIVAFVMLLINGESCLSNVISVVVQGTLGGVFGRARGCVREGEKRDRWGRAKGGVGGGGGR